MYTIGLLIDYLEMSYANKIIQGCIKGANDLGINLIIYPGSALNEDRKFSLEQVGSERYSGRHTFQRTILYEYAKVNHLDGIIISAATVGTYLSEEEFDDFLRSFSVPILLLEKKKEGISSLTFSDDGIELAMKHLIRECNRKRIAYVSGPLNNDDAVKRLNTYERVMQESGMVYPPHWIAYGDFSPFCEEPIKELIINHHDEIDAICVANDAMCIPVYKYLKECGLTIGEEIAVTGYDNTDIAVDSNPQLTSVNANPESLGYQAIKGIVKRISTGEVNVDVLPVELEVRSSTNVAGDNENKQYRNEQAAGLHNEQSLKNVYINSIATDMLMYSNDEETSLRSAIYNLNHAGICEFYVFLYEESFEHERKQSWKLPQTVIPYIAYNEAANINIVGTDHSILLDDAMKDELSTSQQRIITAFPIEVMGEHYGILYLSYHTDLCVDVFSIANQFATVLHINHLILKLKDATEAKSNFLASMSHEIRTPLNAVLGMNEMILRESNEEDVVEYATHIERSGKTLLTLINEILDLSKIESGKMEIIPVEYDTKNLFVDLYNMIQPRAEKKKLVFRMVIDDNLPSRLYGDDVRIKQIITNLLTNAVKYTPSGNVLFQVKGQYEEDKVTLMVSVQDSGIGIREEDREKLFTNFQRLDEEKNRNIEGTGLGLGITIRFLEMMNSQLQVDSIYGEGSTFSFVLEQGIIDKTPIGDINSDTGESRIEKRNHKKQIIAPEANVLVVDDNEMNRVVVENLLKATKVKLDTLDSGANCIKAVQEKDYDIIFLDHMMPDMDGIETVQHLRTYWREHHKQAPPVIILTANAIAGAKEMYLEKGFDDYLSKPIDTQRLEGLLVQYLPCNYIQEVEKVATSKVQELEMWKTISGIDIHEAMLHNSSEDMFLKLLELFYDGIEAKALEIENYEKQEQIKEFTIQVHALKSTARTIGATVLSELAAELELAGDQGDIAKIHNDTGLLLSLYRKYREFLSEHFRPVSVEDELLIEKLIECVDAIRNAMENFDLEQADEEMSLIKGIKIPEGMEVDFEELKEGVLNFKIEETKEIARSICERLSKY